MCEFCFYISCHSLAVHILKFSIRSFGLHMVFCFFKALSSVKNMGSSINILIIINVSYIICCPNFEFL
jgi:hypothetical protein